MLLLHDFTGKYCTETTIQPLKSFHGLDFNKGMETRNATSLRFTFNAIISNHRFTNKPR